MFPGNKPVRRMGLVVDDNTLDIPAFRRRGEDSGLADGEKLEPQLAARRPTTSSTSRPSCASISTSARELLKEMRRRSLKRLRRCCVMVGETGIAFSD